MARSFLATTAFAGVISLAAYGQNSAETAGEKADYAIENAAQGHENPGDGPLEQASVDNPTGAHARRQPR